MVSLRIFTISYAALLIAFTSYWAENFSRHSSYKGDEFFYYAELVVVLTYILYLLILFKYRKSVLLLLISPIIIFIATMYIGVFISLLSDFGGIPREYIWLFGTIYGILSLINVFVLANKFRRNRSDA